MLTRAALFEGFVVALGGIITPQSALRVPHSPRFPLAPGPERSYFAAVKRTLLAGTTSLILAVAPVACSGLEAQAAGDSSDSALRQDYEERFKRLNVLVEDMLAAQATLQRRISDLAAELVNVRQEQSRAANQAVRPDDVRKLADKLREIEQKREDDRRLILEEIRKLAQTPVPEPPPRKEKPKEKEPEPPPVPAATGPQNGYEYIVKQGDTPGAIVAAYRQSGVKVTMEQFLKANPNLKPKSMRVGQKVFIPEPGSH